MLFKVKQRKEKLDKKWKNKYVFKLEYAMRCSKQKPVTVGACLSLNVKSETYCVS